jgi:hypothetical protein
MKKFKLSEFSIKIKGKAVPVTGCGGPHFLDSQFTDGGEIVSLMYRSPITPRKIPGTNFS